MNELTETQKAYLAGMLDGEGCINISALHGKYHFLQVIIVGSKIDHIQQCFEMVGAGSCTIQKRKGSTRADVAFWVMHSNDAAAFLEQVYPYLICKKDQAHLAMKFQRHKKSGPPYNNRHPMPRRVFEYRVQLMEELQAMKKGGKIYDESIIEIEEPMPDWLQPSLMFS